MGLFQAIHRRAPMYELKPLIKPLIKPRIKPRIFARVYSVFKDTFKSVTFKAKAPLMETARGKLHGEIFVWTCARVRVDKKIVSLRTLRNGTRHAVRCTARGKVYGAGSSEMKQNKLRKTCVCQIKVVYLHHQCRYTVQFKVNGTAKCL
jgi:hypothetical protein